MGMKNWRRALAVGLLAASPAAAQEVATAPTAVPKGGGLPPDGAIFGTVEPDQGLSAPSPRPPDRSGLLGWRRRHSEFKRHLQEKVIGYPEEFNEWPLGRAVYAHGRTQVAKGEAARMIFNDYDFVGQTTELNYRGRDKFASMTARLPATFQPVTIERTPWAPGLDEERRLAILSRLAEGPFPVPAERVLVGPAAAQGLGGQEAALINPYRQGLFYNGGAGGAVGGFDASGLSDFAGGQGAGASVR